MALPPAFHLLGFEEVPVERKSAWGPGLHTSRQVTIDGTPLGEVLAARLGHPVEQSTPLVDGRVGAITPAAYLRALLGGPKDDPLRDGRVAIGYCDACLDATCGVLLAADLAVDADGVTWTNIGFDQYDEGPAPKLKAFWKRSSPEPEPEAEPEAEPHEVWQYTPFQPEIGFRFGREQYLEAIQSERRRLAATQ